MSIQTKWYGWKKDQPDGRDFQFVPKISPRKLPAVQINSDGMPCVFDQGEAGTCTGHTGSEHIYYAFAKQGDTFIFIPSRLFLYYGARTLEGMTEPYFDSGAQIRDVIKSAVKWGVCNETSWPYDLTKLNTRPGPTCWMHGKSHQTLDYRRVPQTKEDLKSCIADGWVFSFGFAVFESFESDEVTVTGRVPMPNLDKEEVIGEHAVLGYGYSDYVELPGNLTGGVLCRNSWGEDWGEFGNFWIPYDYILNPNLAADFWTIRRVEV